VPIYGYVIDALVTALTAALVFALWVANRRRIAAQTIGKADEHAARVIREAEREVETRKKEALLEAKEKAHELMLDVHEKGRAVVSAGTREEMERDVEAMHGYGLWATMQHDE